MDVWCLHFPFPSKNMFVAPALLMPSTYPTEKPHHYFRGANVPHLKFEAELCLAPVTSKSCKCLTQYVVLISILHSDWLKKTLFCFKLQFGLFYVLPLFDQFDSP